MAPVVRTTGTGLLIGISTAPPLAFHARRLVIWKTPADEAEKLLVGGFKAVTLAEDLAVMRAVRERLPKHIEILVDYNQALTAADALFRGRALQNEGVSRLEESIRHNDYSAYARLAAELRLPIRLGENFNGTHQEIYENSYLEHR